MFRSTLTAATSASLTYSAVLNKYAVVGTTGNPNEDVELTYGNSSSVASVPGNTVYVYTYGVNVMKKNENGTALSGAKFSIYKTNDNAQNNQNAIGSGTSDSNGKVMISERQSVQRIITTVRSRRTYTLITQAHLS